MYGIIYKITCLIDGKSYVGQTVRTIEERFQEHTQAETYIGNAIRAHGVENFSCEVIEECDTREQLNEREIFWIATLNCKAPNGYNLTDGGEGTSGVERTPETRAKMSKTHKGKHHTDETRAKMSKTHKGKHHTDETRAKMSKTSKGRKKSPETRSKMSIAHSGEKNPFFGKRHTDEAKAKNATSNRKESSYKNLLTEMDARQLTYTALAKLLDLSQPNISEKMRGKKNFTAEQIAKLVEIFDKPAEYLMAH